MVSATSNEHGSAILVLRLSDTGWNSGIFDSLLISLHPIGSWLVEGSNQVLTASKLDHDAVSSRTYRLKFTQTSVFLLRA